MARTSSSPNRSAIRVGYQLTPDLHVLLELKAHRFEVRGADRNQKVSYTTFSVGPGLSPARGRSNMAHMPPSGAS